MSDEKAICGLCGEPMPEGEQIFEYHGYSGPCPKPPLPQASKPNTRFDPDASSIKEKLLLWLCDRIEIGIIPNEATVDEILEITGTTDKREAGWLIETARQTYWDGRQIGDGATFVSDPNEAIRFARFEDAEIARCRLLEDTGKLRSSEHIFLPPHSVPEKDDVGNIPEAALRTPKP